MFYVGFSLATAYQLRVCQPPPEVANADALMEDTEFEIGRMVFPSFSVILAFTKLNSCNLKKTYDRYGDLVVINI